MKDCEEGEQKRAKEYDREGKGKRRRGRRKKATYLVARLTELLASKSDSLMGRQLRNTRQNGYRRLPEDRSVTMEHQRKRKKESRRKREEKNRKEMRGEGGVLLRGRKRKGLLWRRP